MYEYKCKIAKIVDADTIDISIDLGFSVATSQRVRVFGVNAPEVHSKDSKEKARGLAAVEEVKKLLPIGLECLVRSEKPGAGDKFGRYLATFILPDGRDFAKVMTDLGHFITWDGTGLKPI